MEIDNKDSEAPVDPHTGLLSATTAISYRSEPMRNRLPLMPNHEGGVTDEDISMSSWAYGDPATPMLETYPDEPFIIRLLDGAHEEQHAFNIEGMSWRKEITDPVSPIVEEQTIGISEAFNIRIDKPYSAGDYLYYFGGIDDLWLGLWGIIRVHNCIQKNLLPLCREQNLPPPKKFEPPKGAVVRKFSVAAIQKNLVYNKYGDHDPDGLLFVPLDNVYDVIKGKEKPIPLILRANAGDWIEVTLYNMFDTNRPIKHFEYPSVPLEYPHKPSDRVSLNPQFLSYDPIRSSGINVGYNKVEQTAGPGEKIRYLWHADKEYGACIINSFGDVRNHRYHGLFGAIIIEPVEAVWFDGLNCRKKTYGEQAIITSPEKETFREFVLFAQNGIRLLDKNGNLIKTTEQDAEESAHGAPDHEDTGEKGYNYRSERFFNRLKQNPQISKVFSSKEH